jgi:hypothetical protein
VAFVKMFENKLDDRTAAQRVSATDGTGTRGARCGWARWHGDVTCSCRVEVPGPADEVGTTSWLTARSGGGLAVALMLACRRVNDWLISLSTT